jgi:hypothetical protein
VLQDVTRQVKEVLFGVYDIDVGGVHNQEGGVGVMKEVLVVGGAEILQVGAVEIAL